MPPARPVGWKCSKGLSTCLKLILIQERDGHRHSLVNIELFSGMEPGPDPTGIVEDGRHHTAGLTLRPDQRGAD